MRFSCLKLQNIKFTKANSFHMYIGYIPKPWQIYRMYISMNSIQFRNTTFLFICLLKNHMNVIFATSCNCLCFRLHSMKKITFFSKGIRDSTNSPRNNLFFFSKSKRKSKMHHFIMAMSKLLFAFYFLFDIYHLHLLICLML